jgi:hypothetical protein
LFSAGPVRVTQRRYRTHPPHISPDDRWITFGASDYQNPTCIHISPFLNEAGPAGHEAARRRAVRRVSFSQPGQSPRTLFRKGFRIAVTRDILVLNLVDMTGDIWMIDLHGAGNRRPLVADSPGSSNRPGPVRISPKSFEFLLKIGYRHPILE